MSKYAKAVAARIGRLSPRTKALSIVALFTVASFGVGVLLTPWMDVVAVVATVLIAITATPFAAVYMLTRPWWETLIGCAMLASSTGLALLADISLIYRMLGDDYRFRAAVLLTVLTWIVGGSTFKLVALFAPRWLRWLPGMRGASM